MNASPAEPAMKIRPLLVVLLTLATARVLAATEIIQLNYRMADELLPIAQSILGGDGRVNAYGDRLIANAPAAKIQELRGLLEQLDSPPRRLLISVDNSEAKTGERHGYAMDGSVDAGNVEIQAGRGQIHDENRVRILNRGTASRNGVLQQIQATEGYPAQIKTGQSVPLRSTHIGPHGRQVYRETDYLDITRSLYVIARISGDNVHITLGSNNDRLDTSRPRVIDIQSLDTQVSGRLGEWIELGNASESRQSDHQGLLRQHSASSQEELSMRLKAEILD
ncbi:secretin N-terminal domain-containing protein [Azotobacter beijerinckii]|nr:secretin N-terminal domain-containing protein [Azotobacter beijerinckii]